MYPSDVEEPMQMEFLLGTERENPLEELQSMHLSVCLSLSVCVSVCRCSLCVREHVSVHTDTRTTLSHTPTHTSTSPHTPLYVLHKWY